MKKLLKIFVAIIIIITAMIIIEIKYGIVKSKLSFIINKIAMTIVETEEYKNEFIETKYKNYKIIHNKEFTPALSMVFAYLDNMELRSYELLGYTPKEELTIQIDYDEDVFKARNSIGISVEDAVGYYNSEIKTIYMLAEDPYNDVIMDNKKIEKLPDGIVFISSTTFSEVLFHEYTHYIFNNFISENDIDELSIPIWFQEGISEYIASANKLSEGDLDFVSLNKLNTINDWVDSCNNENAEVYIQSMYAIYSIVNLSDESKLKDIIVNCKEMSFDDSFKMAMGLSLTEFEDNLRNEFSNYEEMYKSLNNSSYYYEVKIKGLEEYIKANEDNIRAYQTLSVFYENYIGFDKALEFLKESVEKYPDEPNLWRSLAILYENNDMPELARECYLKEEKLMQ